MKKKTAKKPAQKKKKTIKKKNAVKKKISKKVTAKKAGRLLSPGEPLPYRIENVQGKGIGLVICDHAGSRVPRTLKDLGIDKADLKKHIGWDIGAEDAAQHISRTLDMPLVLATYSRLVLDLNRAPHHEECIPETSDHIDVPANAGLSKAQREQRLKEIFWPYQNKIGKMIDAFGRKKQIPILLSIHSMTPEMDGVKRPWHLSILWNREAAIAKQIVHDIRSRHPDLLVGENQPYTLFSDRFPGSTIHRHAEERGLPYVFVEFRQDLLDTKEKASYWAGILLQALHAVLDNPATWQGRKMKPAKK